LDETTAGTILAENTTVANESLVQAESTSKAGTVKVKKKGKPKLTPKEKKERSVRLVFFFRLGGAQSLTPLLRLDGD
jgi:hypothetical protein